MQLFKCNGEGGVLKVEGGVFGAREVGTSGRISSLEKSQKGKRPIREGGTLDCSKPC